MFAPESTEVIVDFPQDDQGIEPTIDPQTIEEQKLTDDIGDPAETSSAKAEEVENPEEKGLKRDTTPKLIEFKEDVILKNLAEEIKSSGIEIEVDEGETTEKFINKLSDNIIRKELSNPESLIYQSVKTQILDENGIDDRILSIASGIPFGVDREEFVSLLNLKEYSEDDFDLSDTENLKQLFATYHTLKGVSDEDIFEYVETDLSNVSQDLVNKRKKFINDSAIDGLNQINKFVEDKKNAQKKYNQQIVEKINGFIKKGEVGGYSFSKDEFESFIRASTVRDQEIELVDGSKRKVTALEKKRYELQRSDYEKALLDDMLFFFDRDSSIKKKKEDANERKQTGGFMKKLNEDLKDYKTPSFQVKNDQGDKIERIISF